MQKVVVYETVSGTIMQIVTGPDGVDLWPAGLVAGWSAVAVALDFSGTAATHHVVNGQVVAK